MKERGTLSFADGLSLPPEAVTQTFAFLARRGAGKTYGASKLCEEMLEVGAQAIVLDPVGNWYALRLGADGKSKGYPVPVLGGLHGDVPLEPTAGALIADTLVAHGTSAVLDVSMFRKGERKRFAADFAEQFFERKKAKRSPVHLFIEEAQAFVPQRVGPEDARMLGAFEDLVKLGRNFGIGCTLISQRPQAVNKDALNQTECLVVLQTNGSQERKALREWIVDQGLDVGELVDSLPGLKRGEAWVWSPSWLGLTKRVHIGKKRTLNASATPEMGKAFDSKPLAPIDLDVLRTAMAETVKRAEADNPKALRKRIAELEAQLKKAPAKVVEKPVLSDRELQRLEAFAERALKGQEVLIEALKTLAPVLRPAHALGWSGAKVSISRPVAAPLPPRTAVVPRTPRANQAPPGELRRGERAILVAVAQHSDGVTREQLTVLTGYKRSSRDTYLQRLTSGGLVEQSAETLVATQAGVDALGADFEPLPTGEALREHWLRRLTGGERRIFELVTGAYPNELTRDLISQETGYKRSSRDTYLQRLNSRQLIETDRATVRANSALFWSAA